MGFNMTGFGEQRKGGGTDPLPVSTDLQGDVRQLGQVKFGTALAGLASGTSS